MVCSSGFTHPCKKPYMHLRKLLLLSFIATTIGHGSFARQTDSLKKKYPIKFEFTISEGILSQDEFMGILGKNMLQQFMSFPTSMTGCLFVSYKRAITQQLFVGVTIGKDHQDGTLGFPPHSQWGDEGINFGSYSRRVATYAAEGKYILSKRKRTETYVVAGAGITSSKETFTSDTATYNHSLKYIMYSNPLNRNLIHPNGQLSWGVRYSSSRSIACFLELGYGYRGIFNCGISARF